MRIIDKKCYPLYFQSVLKDEKRFELRKDVDGVQVGDVMRLREWNPDSMEYTGRFVEVPVRYVLRNVPHFGLMPGYCVIGF